MKNSEINLKIAEKLIKSKNLHYSDEYIELLCIKDKCPDYINDPVQREPLMIELGLTHWQYRYEDDAPEHNEKFMGHLWYSIRKNKNIINKHLGMSTCLAWIEMKESKNGQD